MLSGDQKLDPRNVCDFFGGPTVLNSAVKKYPAVPDNAHKRDWGATAYKLYRYDRLGKDNNGQGSLSFTLRSPSFWLMYIVYDQS
jgi:hypothetical protein